MKRRLILALAVCLTAQALAQGRALDKAPWNQHPWSAEEVAIPLLRNAIETINSYPDSADLLIEEARKHLGKPYRYGGKGPDVFDCAGFARYVYLKFGFLLPGGSIPQYRMGRHVDDPRRLQRGDLVFWQGRSGTGGVGHTGIVTEVDTLTGIFRFIHAATSTGVIHSYSNEAYYATRYIGATRLLGNRKKPETPLPRRRK
ncbi:MAG: C40 family peptidase [Bacteroidales bacterium]|nr:C40 family peptidase [Bacteroidales bacterium]